MSGFGALPGDPGEKLAYLERAAHHGEALRSLLAVGGSVEPVYAYVAAHPVLSCERAGADLAIRYGELVRWDVTLGEGDRIEGYGASGYGPLMEALGIDFSGRPYTAGNG
jgi:hypothetical protein